MVSNNRHNIEAVNYRNSLSLDETQQQYGIVRHAFNNIHTINILLNNLSGKLLELNNIYIKQDSQSIGYQNTAKKIDRNPKNDRVFPLDTIELKQFNTKHNSDIEKAIIHIGPFANELTRSFNALALTIGDNIYFRDKAYNPGSEESRKIIAHELTHVTQYKEKRISKNSSRETMELEAEQAENREVSDEDGYIMININGNRYRFLKSKMRYYAGKVSEHIEKWVGEQNYILDEKDYLKLLHKYEKWVKKI
jgi:hypothetical protein